MRRKGKSKHLLFWLYFVPFIIVWLLLIIMDMLASGFYLVEYFYVFSVNGLMRLMEIQNVDAMRPVFEHHVSFGTRTWPSMIMFAAASKCLLFLAVSIIVMIAFPMAAWQVCKQNYGAIIIPKPTNVSRRSMEPLEEEFSPAASPTPHPVNVVVSHAEPSGRVMEDVNDESTFEPQPAFNPYVTERKYETHF